MAASVRVELNSPGIAALLRSDEVQQEMERVAGEVAQRARSRGVMVDGKPGEVPIPVTVEDARGKRARALVVLDHPSGEATEAKDRLLGGALG